MACEIGRDLLPAGRLVRILVAVLLLADIGASVLHSRHVAQVLGQGAAFFVLFAAGYTVAIGRLGERFWARVDGWTAALVLLAPGMIVSALPFVPGTVSLGFGLYIAVGLVAQAAIRYGGCEVAGLPTLLLRRRYRVYCVLNGADVVEGWLQRRPAWVKWAGTLAALAAIGGLVALLEAVGPGWLGKYGYLMFLAAGLLVQRVTSSARAASAA